MEINIGYNFLKCAVFCGHGFILGGDEKRFGQLSCDVGATLSDINLTVHAHELSAQVGN